VRAGTTDGQDAGAADDVAQQLVTLSAIHGTEISSDELQRMAHEMGATRPGADVVTETMP
jgi:hypothetical protein